MDVSYHRGLVTSCRSLSKYIKKEPTGQKPAGFCRFRLSGNLGAVLEFEDQSPIGVYRYGIDHCQPEPVIKFGKGFIALRQFKHEGSYLVGLCLAFCFPSQHRFQANLGPFIPSFQGGVKSITINSDLSEEFQRIICAHELGHAILHKDQSGVKAFHDFALFDAASRFEYEANIFAAEYLLKDIDVLELLNDDLSFFQAAAQLYVPAEILDFKFRTLKWKGYKVIDAPLRANSNWLKNAPDGGQ